MEKLVIKRSNKKVPFERNKISNAILKAMERTGIEDEKAALEIAKEEEEFLYSISEFTPTVDIIHDRVENKLMDKGLYTVAKEYIIYRDQNKPNIFRKRINIKPYEYPSLVDYIGAIRNSYWIHTEFNYTSDIHDLKVNLTPQEKTTLTRAMLAISQIENKVKTFWGEVGERLPKPEIAKVGATFSESEVRHEDAYSHLLEITGLNEEFKSLIHIPAIRKRIKYLEKSLVNSRSNDNREYFESIILFSMFIENVSLFSQFLVIMSFNKHKNLLKGMSNAVEATSKEEKLHAEFGFDLVNIIKKENPGWWTDELVEDIIDITLDAYDAESEIVEWMFEEGDLDFLTKKQTLEFIKDRFNQSLEAIGIEKVFKTDSNILLDTEWFEDEILTTKHTDFFYKRSINYSKKAKSVTEDDLF